MWRRQYDPTDCNNVVVAFTGPVGAGKSTLLSKMTKTNLPEDYTPTYVDTFAISYKAERRHLNVIIVDCHGSTLRESRCCLDLKNLDMICFCFSVDSFEIFNKLGWWRDNINYYSPFTPIFLIGTKTDLRETFIYDRFITYEEAVKKAEEMGFAGYSETSGHKRTGIQETLDKFMLWLDKNCYTQELDPEIPPEYLDIVYYEPWWKRLWKWFHKWSCLK